MICKETRQRYIGVRSCKVDPKIDKYQSSSKVIRQMITDGYTFSKRVLSEFSTRSDAVQHEINLHSTYDVARSDKYLNQAKQTSTGWDMTGVKHSDEARDKISKRLKGHPVSDKLLEIWHQPHTPEHSAKISASLKGYVKSAEHISKIKLSNKGKVISEKTRRKISQAVKGRVMSEDTRIKMSIAAKERWANRGR
jgi:hypothetical protein